MGLFIWIRSVAVVGPSGSWAALPSIRSSAIVSIALPLLWVLSLDI
jgi:hypothetical protein